MDGFIFALQSLWYIFIGNFYEMAIKIATNTHAARSYFGIVVYVFDVVVDDATCWQISAKPLLRHQLTIQ